MARNAAPAWAIVALACLLCQSAARGQDTIWLRQFGGSNNEEADAISADANGVYVVGYWAGVGYLAKFSLDGQTLHWNDKFINGYDVNRARGVCARSGFIYVAGYTLGWIVGQTPVGQADAFVMQYDTDGTRVWTRQFGTTARDYGDDVAADATGIYVVGDTEGAFTGDPNVGYTDVFIRKYDSSGDVSWTDQFGSSGVDYGNCGSCAADAVYVGGEIHPEGGEPPPNGIYTEQHDQDGAQQWLEAFGTGNVEYGWGVAGVSGAVYVCGGIIDALPGQTWYGGRDAYVRKYDSSGNPLWTRQFGTSADDEAYEVSADASGVYVVGYTGGALPGCTSAGMTDVFVRKYDANGSLCWTKQFGSAEDDAGTGACAAADGLYIAGWTDDVLPGQTSAGRRDPFVAKLSLSGPTLASPARDTHSPAWLEWWLSVPGPR